MKNIIRIILKYLPRKFRHALVRRSLRIPLRLSKQVVYKLAESQHDLEQAFHLLHDCYVAQGLMDPHPSGMRCTLYSALPYTSILVAKFKSRVIGTVSLIKDSSLGMPSDSDFKEENNELRRRGYKLVEVSALAVHPKFRKSSSVINYYMMKYLVEYSLKHIGADTLVATTHPKAMDLYQALFGFEISPRVINYQFVKGALAAHGYLHFTADYWAQLRFSAYKNRKASRSFASFYWDVVGPYEFPPMSPIQNMPVMTIDTLRYFFMNRTDLFETISRAQLTRVLSIYNLYFDVRELGIPIQASELRYAFRFQTDIQASLNQKSEVFFGVICDMSTGGVFFSTQEDLVIGGVYDLHFKIKNKSYQIPITVRWKNESVTDYRPNGYGLQFSGVDQGLIRMLCSLHMSYHNAETKAGTAQEKTKKTVKQQ